MTALGTLWQRLWFAPASPYPVAAFRILLGGYLCVYLGALAPYVPIEFSSEGVYAPYFVPDYAPSPAIAWLLYAALLACCAALCIGFRVAWVIPCLLLLYLHHYFLSLAIKHSSFERLLVIYLLALWPARSDCVWAVSTPSRAQDVALAAVPVFTARLVRFQTVMLYLGAGLWKAFNPAWRSGALLLATMQGVWATPLAFALVRTWPTQATWQLASYAVFGGELLIAVCFSIPRARVLAIALGTLFHLSNVVILAIPEFVLCIAPYVFFVRDETWEGFAAALARLRTRSRAGA